MSSRGTQGMRASRLRADGPLDMLSQPINFESYWIRGVTMGENYALMIGQGTYGGIFIPVIGFSGGKITIPCVDDPHKSTVLDGETINAPEIISEPKPTSQGSLNGADFTFSRWYPQISELGGRYSGVEIVGALNLVNEYLGEDTSIACSYLKPSAGKSEYFIGHNFVKAITVDGDRKIIPGYCSCIHTDTLSGDISAFKSAPAGAYYDEITWGPGAFKGIIKSHFVKSAVSDVVLFTLSAGLPKSVDNTVYTKLLSIIIPDPVAGLNNSLRLKWTVENETGDSCTSQIYVNGVAVGVEKVGAGDHNDDLAGLKAGDTLELWGKVGAGDKSNITAYGINGELSAYVVPVNPWG